MISPKLDDDETRDIDAVVRKVIRGLGYPEPPLRLDDVRELQRLDRGYYSSSDDGVLREAISRLRIAGKQVLERPRLLLDVIRQCKLSALWLPDRKRILIDSALPKIKQRWAEVHEVGHSLVPWHEDFLFGDDANSLSQACHEQLEAEANYAAGQLLFLQDRFRSDAGDVAPTIANILALKERYGNSITSTLWRFVESHADQAMFGAVVTPSAVWSGAAVTEPCRYFIQSARFRTEFPAVTEAQVVGLVVTSCRWGKRRGPLGTHDALLTNARGEPIVFHLESFCNTHDILTLGRAVRPNLVLV